MIRPHEATFADRHIGSRRADEVDRMLTTVGFDSLDALAAAAVPPSIALDGPLELPAGRTEAEVLAALRDLAARNTTRVQMIGQGYSDTITPAVIRRGIVENPAWYTAYTPYQPEISQGRLEALLNFQTAVADLTGLEIAGASLLDEATAVAEAVLLMRRANGRGEAGDGVTVLDANLHPQSIAIVRARALALGFEVVTTDLAGGLPDGPVNGLVIQQPGTDGNVSDASELIASAHERGALVTVATDLLALTLLTPPGEQGADIAVGSAQRFGVPLFAGGPHAAFMSVRKGLERQLPGRLVGVSTDAAGRPAYRLALQTREQHIRRERATSNICTAQALLAIVAGAYAVHHGPEGLAAIAQRVHEHALDLARRLTAAGATVTRTSFFDTVTIRVPGRAAAIVAAADEVGINLRHVDADAVGIACDETTTVEIVDRLVEAVASVLGDGDGDVRPGGEDVAAAFGIDPALRRTSEFLTHPVFHEYRSETRLMRYLRRLADRDLALDRTMIPLGSCTMKLNAAVEMEAITWPAFALIHPFAPAAQTVGWDELVADLEARLATVTGYDRVSIQPNAGSQGELAGLLAIRGYHRSRGEAERDVCLIPASAHGTNAASAVLAGLRVVVVATAADGTIDLDDLAAKLTAHEGRVAAIMITYPSTHGVFEADVREVCDTVHAAGGQVYIDGANMNALVGLAKPGEFGGDVSHLNLHKTFCIPHGGGGPGVGPVAVREHLAPFLPADATTWEPDDEGGVPVSASRSGSAGVLPISWAYLELMGGEGLTEATRAALLTANYVAKRLDPFFPVLYTDEQGLVAHECILDLRALTKRTGVTAEDVAKRLIDFGFHAPTLSFPVAGTLMVEPTESEDLTELDRFVDAMIAIRAEIDEIADGTIDVADSPLRHAPHTSADVVSDTWERAYSREQAAFPGRVDRQDKYFPPVSRIDAARGDRNLVCSCPPIEALAENADDVPPEPARREEVRA
ncbi:aminomethyl-transferring glycine dehydrogenase [Pseudoclavibacter chungangensis]|uniref:Glycine dehydrogenase (decarboxylating) n=1 Tax=Pseudoclavibacter chungangensis TaxID=587635 RepID=A0A7J5BRM8_9MICO|nr:aminomethyl-transferring glycine dehydrogenase [Pseudoclavibacter chungangensis]KAB1654812.1 aminomethyl-transferring glycine dehydrogenase [Pseudoclavibacter chungangensis]NYJ68068.1 glycine dehydrogenase [Pseudoclavibacter chungangensis]